MTDIYTEFTGGLFPRGLGHPFRKNYVGEYYIAQSVEDIKQFIIDHNEIDCYCSVYSYTEYNQKVQNKFSAIIDVIPIDLDSEDLSIAYEELKILLDWCDRHNIEPRLQFTAGKGFHIYIDIKPIILKDPQYVLRKFVEELKDAGNFTCIDICINGDLSRIMRLPNTINSKSGRYCIPLNPKVLSLLTIENIIELSKEKSDYVYVRKPVAGEIHDKLFELDEKREQDIIERPKSKYDRLFPRLSYNIYCQAYENFINGITIKTQSWNQIYCGIVCYMRSSGMDKKEAFDKVIEFNKKCKPPMEYKYIVYYFNYQWTHTFKYCTHFAKTCECCKTCRNRTF